MKQMALRSRMAVLVLAVLLSLTGASVAATVSADEAQASCPTDVEFKTDVGFEESPSLTV